MSEEEVHTFLERCPEVTEMSVHACLAPKINFFREEIGLTRSQVKWVLRKRPKVFNSDVEADLRPKVVWLSSELGMTAFQVRRLFFSATSNLMVSLEDLKQWVGHLKDLFALSDRQVVKVVTGNPAILSVQHSASLHAKEDFLSGYLGLQKSQITNLVSKHPRILRLGVDNMVSKVEFLKENGLKRAVIAKMLMSCPSLFNNNVEYNLEPKVTYFLKELFMRPSQLSKIIEAEPQLLGLSLEDTIIPRVSFLMKEVAIPHDRIRQIITAAPGLLWYSIEDNMMPKVRWFSVELGLHKNELRKVVVNNPQVLGLSLEQNLMPKVAWFKTSLGINEKGLRSMVVKHPALLRYSLDGNINEKVNFFQNEIGIEGPSLTKILVTFPRLLSFSLPSFRERMKFLTEELRLAREQVANIVARAPLVLTYKVDTNMRAKVDFFVKVTTGPHTGQYFFLFLKDSFAFFFSGQILY
ncbi:unnamed protein product [Discosporangium mesarthrocarpum]